MNRGRRGWLLAGLAWASSAGAVDTASTYPDCATHQVDVPWGGSVVVDLTDCHSFGLGVVSLPPTYGTASPADGAPVDSYRYTHAGTGPAKGGSDRFVVLDDNSDTITVNVRIGAGTSTLAGSPDALPAMTTGRLVNLALATTGGTAPYGYRMDGGALPPGLALSSAGLLTGTPTQRGPYSFGVLATDASGRSARRHYAGSVAPGAMALDPTGANVSPGVPVQLALGATGGVPPHRFALEPGPVLPAGLVLSPDGRISGRTQALPGSHALVLRVTDSSTGTGSHFQRLPFTLTVGSLPSVSIAIETAAVAEDEDERLSFRLTRSQALATPTVVNFSTTGTAQTRSHASVTIPAGATSAQVWVKPAPDDRVEPDETVVLTVADGSGYLVGAPASATGTLVNDDPR